MHNLILLFMKLTNCFILASLSFATVAHAAIDSYMKVVPATGGFTGGSGISKSGNIPTMGYTSPTTRVADPSSGLPTGQRQHQTFVVKLQALEAPPFRHALSSKQLLHTVTLYVLKHLPDVKSQVVETYSLENVTVAAVVDGAPPKTGTGIQFVTVSLNFAKMDVNHTLGPITASNAWMN